MKFTECHDAIARYTQNVFLSGWKSDKGNYRIELFDGSADPYVRFHKLIVSAKVKTGAKGTYMALQPSFLFKINDAAGMSAMFVELKRLLQFVPDTVIHKDMRQLLRNIAQHYGLLRKSGATCRCMMSLDQLAAHTVFTSKGVPGA